MRILVDISGTQIGEPIRISKAGKVSRTEIMRPAIAIPIETKRPDTVEPKSGLWQASCRMSGAKRNPSKYQETGNEPVCFFLHAAAPTSARPASSSA